MSIVLSIAASIVGGIIGYSFGFAQKIAADRYSRKQQHGNFSSAWSVMPGSGLRIAYFMILLLIIQITCPLFFDGNIQWIVSAGVVLGYGWTSTQQLRRKMLLK
jgi:hypothetical protein